MNQVLKRTELLERAERIREKLSEMLDAMQAFETWPRFDEDYKIEFYPALNAENFDVIEELANKLRLEWAERFKNI